MIEQGTQEWMDLRCGMATASRFSSILTGTGKISTSIDKYAAGLAADLFNGQQIEVWEGNAATERGHELEDRARNCYAELYKYCDVELASFVKHPEMDAGCSPDGLVGSSGLLEIKNQLKENHVQTLGYFKRNRSAPPDYIPQVQGQMWITGREWCDLFFHHPDLPKLCIRVRRDDEFIDKLIPAVKRCLELRDEYYEMLLSWEDFKIEGETL